MEGLMKKIIFLIFIISMLVACGNSDNKLPKECNDVIETMNVIQRIMDTNNDTSDPMDNALRMQIEEFFRNFKEELRNGDYEKQKKSCKLMTGPMHLLLKARLQRNVKKS